MNNSGPIAKRHIPMKWTEQHDILLCREILLIQPHNYRPKSIERGNAWTSVASDLNAVQEIRFAVTQKAVRDRFKLLVARFKRKMNKEEAASGICPEESELDQALQNIVELTNEAEQQYDKDTHEKQTKLENDRKSAEELRNKAMETFGESIKRQSETGQTQAPNKKKRAAGGETLIYLKEKAEKEFDIRKAELECRKQEMEGNKEADISVQRQQQQQFSEFQKTMMEQCQRQQAMMQRQMQQQALQHQQMMASQAQQQQQNNQLLLALVEKLTQR